MFAELLDLRRFRPKQLKKVDYESIEIVLSEDARVSSLDDHCLDSVNRFYDLPCLDMLKCYRKGDDYVFTENATIEDYDFLEPRIDRDAVTAYISSKGLTPYNGSLRDSIVGSGGFAGVYRADDADGKRYAVKVFWKDTEFSDKTARVEFQVSNFLSGKGRFLEMDGAVLASNYDTLNVPVLISRYLEGIDLGELRFYWYGNPRRQGDAVKELKVIEDLVEQVGVIHRNGIVHNDIAPANTFMSTDGVFCIDAGLAAEVGSSRPSDSNIVFGRPSYMAPERIRGIDAYSCSSDVVSLGRMLFEAYSFLPTWFSKVYKEDETRSDDRMVDTLMTSLMKGSDDRQRYLKRPEFEKGISLNCAEGQEWFVRGVIAKATNPRPSDRFRTAGEMLPYVRMLRKLAEGEVKSVEGSGLDYNICDIVRGSSC